MCSHMIARGGTSKDRARLTPEQAASGADREFSELLFLLPLCPMIIFVIITIVISTMIISSTDISEQKLVFKGLEGCIEGFGLGLRMRRGSRFGEFGGARMHQKVGGGRGSLCPPMLRGLGV